MFKKIGLVSVVAFALFAFNACGDDSSTSGSSDGSNRGGIPDTVETFMELSDYDCGKSQKCVATYLTEYHDMAVCDGDNGWVIGTLIEKMDCDFSSSSAKSSDSKSNDPAGVTDDSSDSKDNPSSAGTSTKSSNSSSSSVTPSDVEGSSKTAWDYLNPDINYGEFTDERDGQIYKTVTIAPAGTGYSEVWMAENLNFETENSWCGGGIGTTEGDCSVYGRLYTWAAAVGRAEDECGIDHACNLGEGDIRGACPKGWHLPSQSEWEALIVAVDGSITEYTSSNTAGTKLKSATRGSWSSYSGITNEDAFGFSALPAGYRSYVIGNYNYWGKGTYFWSSTEETIYYAYVMGLDYRNDGALLTYDSNHKHYGDSVRCLKDSE
ncbi:MAG: fibrobacter succinogenes major paralogous domain-containing protein [Fibrobacter sp.]|nr:fibrobacter succinogenes major paralogous domain-containing protein [Fibrobacter sp.]